MRLIYLALLLVALPLSSFGKEATFKIDYFGVPFAVACEVGKAGGRIKSFDELADRNAAEIGPCLTPLIENLSARRNLEGYAQVLLFERFVAALPYTDKESSSSWTSFAQAVRAGRPLSRRDRIVLLYSMLSESGYAVGVMRSRGYYFLTLQIDDDVSGHWWGRQNRYAWEPGRPLSNAGRAARLKRAEDVTFNRGRSINFILPDLAWEKTRQGTKKTFVVPDGCPKNWRRQITRLPDYEHFLSFWPRDRQVQARNAHQVLEPFGFDEVISLKGSGLGEEEFGTCLLRYEIMNLGYDWEHAKENRATQVTRNPAEALFLGGDCDELSYALIGLLRIAGVPKDNIRVLRWDNKPEPSHMNIGVAPLTGKLSEGSYVELRGVRYYVMDPAYSYTYNGRLATTWGMLAERFQGKSTEIHPIR